MISSFVYLCILLFEKTHLDLITCQRRTISFEIDSSYLQDISAWLVMVNWGGMKDLEPFITWCPTRKRRKIFNLFVAEVRFNQCFITCHCWCPLQIKGIGFHLRKMLVLHYQSQRCVRSTLCLKWHGFCCISRNERKTCR